MSKFTLAACLISVMALPLLAAEPPSTQPAEKPVFFVTDMRLQTINGFTYVYDSAQTTFEKIHDPIKATVPELEKAMAAGKFRPAGSMVFIYRDLKGMDQPFTLEIGFPVPAETTPFGEFKVAKIEPFKCATALFSGPLSKITEAYQKLMPQIFAAGLKPTTVTREFYLYFEGPESPNNVVQIQVGIE